VPDRHICSRTLPAKRAIRPSRPDRRPPAAVALLAAASLGLLSSCTPAEKRMVLKVERLMAAEHFDDALQYLDGYLARHRKSLAGWRYRVLIRLEQGERATAAGEYARLAAALERQEPDVLREVVLGSGGRWLVSDYRALARCAPAGVADAAFFAGLLEPKLLGSGSMSKVAVSADEIAAVLDALPGTLPAAETWPILAKYLEDPSPELRGRAIRGVGRHLAAGGLPESASYAALDALRAGASHPDPELREAALLAALRLPEGPGRESFAADLVRRLALAGDGPRAVGAFLLGPGGSGPVHWRDNDLKEWEAAAQGPLRVLAISALQARQPTPERGKALIAAQASKDAGVRLAAESQFGTPAAAPGRAGTVFGSLSVEERRLWGPAFARSRGPDQRSWVSLALQSSDALVAQGAARALAIPGIGPDPAVDGQLETALGATDASTRAAAGRAAVIRGATSLVLQVSGLFAQGDDRVMNEVLQALVESGDPAWAQLVAQGLRAELPTVRELAVDAGAALCRAEDREGMFDLLDDEDPHVAVRAAAALYLLIGGSPPAPPAAPGS
jgi:hypothetical protein